jgi:hypothetical protein
MYVAEWFIECSIFFTESDIGSSRKVKEGRVWHGASLKDEMV